ncbi:MAG: Na+/H+ antiporter subunit E [Candidatus Acetothermia bacterium]|jgi:multicomponent Na+:H+ antiporter subunit E|nr:Na+/H+ antiporter subunit E [Candidatus Acetothermia bacterium]
MRRVAEWTATGIFAFAVYLLLATFTGSLGLWAPDELIAGAVLAAVTALATGAFLWAQGGWRLLQPQRWILFLLYLIGPFLWAMAKANLDVAWRVITGRIRPGIVRFNPNLHTDFGRTLLANSITLTPGTLTVDIDDDSGDFYVHWINVTDESPTPERVCGSFPKWARRIAE